MTTARAIARGAVTFTIAMAATIVVSYACTYLPEAVDALWRACGAMP